MIGLNVAYYKLLHLTEKHFARENPALVLPPLVGSQLYSI